MQQVNIQFKIILPLIIGLFLIASVSIYTNFFLLEKNISNKADERFEQMSVSLATLINEDINLMLGLIEQLEKDQKTVKYYKDNDIESLYWYLLKTYESYNERYDITHFYIHKPDKKNFLRVHNKEKHSDFIDRKTLNTASTTFKASSGVEFGISHNLTLRVVIPWIVEGELLGYIELGKDIDKLTPKLAQSVNVDIIFTIKKELISNENYETWKRNNINGYYKMMDNHYIIASTIEKVDHELQIALDKNVVHENHEYVENKDSRYFIHSSPFYDINTNEVGSFHILIDISGEYEFLSELLINVTIVILVLLSFMIMYYFKFLQKIEKKLNDAYKEIELISITDVLTNLNNKRYYLENAPKQINTCSRCNAYISFILLDVDNFKQYNDNYGHLQGDVVLQEISLSIKDVFQRTSDCCYRVGGEEFLIVSESEDENNGYKMAEKLREAIIDLNIEHKYNISLTDLTVSIGVCTQKTDKTTKIEELYNSADIALYKSKENGRNQVTLFDNIT